MYIVQDFGPGSIYSKIFKSIADRFPRDITTYISKIYVPLPLEILKIMETYPHRWFMSIFIV
jgi:hypothetical protein